MIDSEKKIKSTMHFKDKLFATANAWSRLQTVVYVWMLFQPFRGDQKIEKNIKQKNMETDKLKNWSRHQTVAGVAF